MISKIIGIITDGDIRRMLKSSPNFLSLKAKDIMNTSPKQIENSRMAVDALKIMETSGISQLLVHDKNKYAGVVHLHDLITEGIL